MHHNFQFSFKRVICQHFLFYYFILIFFIKCFFCNVHFSVKAISIDPEEVIRRRSLVESYLKETVNNENDWIETYHENLLESSVYYYQKDNTASSKVVTDHSLQESLKGTKNEYENQDSLKNDKKQTLDCHISKQILNFNTKSKNFGKINKASKLPIENEVGFHSEAKSEIVYSSKLTCKRIDQLFYSNAAKNAICTDDDIKSNKLNQFSTIPRNQELEVVEFKNHSINPNTIIEILTKDSKFNYEKYFINAETLTHTEFRKLKKTLAHLSFLQSQNSVYSINRMLIIDSINNIKPLFKQNEFNEQKLQQFKKNYNNMSNKPFEAEVSNLKALVTDFQKRMGHNQEHKKKSTQEKTEDSSLYDTNDENSILSSTLKSNTNNFFHDNELLRRKKLLKSFITELNNEQQNWIETYHFSDSTSESRRNLFPISVIDNFKERENHYNSPGTAEEHEQSFKAYSQERSYIIRWINKLKKKLGDIQHDYFSFNILVSTDNLQVLKKLSQEFDVIIFDDFINNIISNATMHNNYAHAFYFDYKYFFSVIYSSVNYSTIFICFTLACSYIFLYNLFLRTNQRNIFPISRVFLIFATHFKWVLSISVLIFSLYWNGYKMYQQKIAEKQSVMSRVVPSYCESILVHESGVLAHLKEYFRQWWHDEDCKKYYEAVMVDPSSEVNPLSINTDLLSDVIFQILQPLARNMNSFYKILTYDLTFIQQFFIIIATFLVLIAVIYFSSSFLAFRYKYKVNLPFHLGSIEPTEFSIGSRVEEVDVKENCLLKPCSDFNSSLVNYTNETLIKNCNKDVILKEITVKYEPKYFKWELSRYRFQNIPKARRNSI